MIDQNRGRIKAANVLQKYHKSRIENQQRLEPGSANKTQHSSVMVEKKNYEKADLKLSEKNKSELANFRFYSF